MRNDIFWTPSTTVHRFTDEDRAYVATRRAIEDMEKPEPVQRVRREVVRLAAPSEFAYEPTDVSSFGQMVQWLTTRGSMGGQMGEAIRILGRAGQWMRVSELASEMALNLVQAGWMVSRMEQKGFVETKRMSDGRRLVKMISPVGSS